MLLLSEWLLKINTENLNRVIMIGFLAMFTVMDIRKQQLSGKLLLIAQLMALGLRFFVEKSAVIDVISGMLPGVLLFLVAYLSHEQIGYADVWVILFVGTLGGVKLATAALVLASISAAVFSLVLCVIKKASKKTALPFVPFIAVAVTASLCI